MFDLNPDVGPLMLDLPRTDAPPASTDPTRLGSARTDRHATRWRSAVGRRLIAMGAALMADDVAARRSVAR